MDRERGKTLVRRGQELSLLKKVVKTDQMAVMTPKYSKMIEIGTKWIEMRWTKNRSPPYHKCHKGDTIYFKDSGKSYIHLRAEVDLARFFSGPSTSNIVRKHQDGIGVDEDYIQEKLKSKAQYLSLFWLRNVERIDPIPFHKNDQRPWIVNVQIIQKSDIQELKEVLDNYR